MRIIVLIALLLAATTTTLFAQHTYIVPVAGTGIGFQHSYESDALVTNVGPGTATVQVGALYRPAGSAPCSLAAPVRTLGRGESAHMNPFCGALFAYTIDSDQPLAVTVAVRMGFTTGCCVRVEQKLDVPTSFIPADTQAVVGEYKNGQGWRAKLLLVNPNDRPITVRADLSRYNSALLGFVAGIQRSYTVPARSLMFQTLEEVPVIPPPNDPDFLIVPEHSLRVMADGEFVAGISMLAMMPLLQAAEYRGAQPLAR